jgi:hypothetical protein
MERYKVCKSGYFDEAENFIYGETIKSFNSEQKAFELLKKLDPEWHYITREEKQHIADGIYDWETDESYGFKGDKWLHDFQGEDNEKAV